MGKRKQQQQNQKQQKVSNLNKTLESDIVHNIINKDDDDDDDYSEEKKNIYLEELYYSLEFPLPLVV